MHDIDWSAAARPTVRLVRSIESARTLCCRDDASACKVQCTILHIFGSGHHSHVVHSAKSLCVLRVSARSA
jgi:hypothetical protein